MCPPGKDGRAVDEPALKVESRAGAQKFLWIAAKGAVQPLVIDQRTVRIAAQVDGFASFDIPVTDLRDGAHPTGHLRCDDKIEVGRGCVDSLAEFLMQAGKAGFGGDAGMAPCGKEFQVADTAGLISIEKCRRYKISCGRCLCAAIMKCWEAIKKSEA